MCGSLSLCLSSLDTRINETQQADGRFIENQRSEITLLLLLLLPLVTRYEVLDTLWHALASVGRRGVESGGARWRGAISGGPLLPALWTPRSLTGVSSAVVIDVSFGTAWAPRFCIPSYSHSHRRTLTRSPDIAILTQHQHRLRLQSSNEGTNKIWQIDRPKMRERTKDWNTEEGITLSWSHNCNDVREKIKALANNGFWRERIKLGISFDVVHLTEEFGLWRKDIQWEFSENDSWGRSWTRRSIRRRWCRKMLVHREGVVSKQSA